MDTHKAGRHYFTAVFLKSRTLNPSCYSEDSFLFLTYSSRLLSSHLTPLLKLPREQWGTVLSCREGWCAGEKKKTPTVFKFDQRLQINIRRSRQFLVPAFGFCNFVNCLAW